MGVQSQLKLWTMGEPLADATRVIMSLHINFLPTSRVLPIKRRSVEEIEARLVLHHLAKFANTVAVPGLGTCWGGIVLAGMKKQEELQRIKRMQGMHT